MAPRTSHTQILTTAQADHLRELLEARGFTFAEKPYTRYAASKGKLQVSVYEKGPKVLVQGKDTEDFVRFVLEPEVLKEIVLGYEEERFPDMFEPHFGIDESGKGDFFGPLVIAGVFVDHVIARRLLDEGVCDSKKIGSDGTIRRLAQVIRDIPGVAWERVLIGPKRYNELHAKFGNLNHLLAWGHATVIEKLHLKVDTCPRALSDQFANESVLKRALKAKGLSIELEQRTKAEADVAVAAASILARECFINWLRDTGEQFNLILPRGASLVVQTLAINLRDRYGSEKLAELGKMHFQFIHGA